MEISRFGKVGKKSQRFSGTIAIVQYKHITIGHKLQCCSETWKQNPAINRARALEHRKQRPTGESLRAAGMFSSRSRIAKKHGGTFAAFTAVFSVCKKASQSFAAAAAKSIGIIFRRGVYMAENTVRPANVRIVRCLRIMRALQQAAIPLSKNPKGFSDSFKARPERLQRSQPCLD